MHARHTQGTARMRAVASKALVNAASIKLVNIASTNTMKRISRLYHFERDKNFFVSAGLLTKHGFH